MAAQQRAGGALCVAETRGFAACREWGATGNMTAALIQGLGLYFQLTCEVY